MDMQINKLAGHHQGHFVYHDRNEPKVQSSGSRNLKTSSIPPWKAKPFGEGSPPKNKIKEKALKPKI
jgi:hypothetical protein